MTLSYKNHSITNTLAHFYMTGPLILNMLTKVEVENTVLLQRYMVAIIALNTGRYSIVFCLKNRIKLKLVMNAFQVNTLLFLEVIKLWFSDIYTWYKNKTLARIG